MRIDDFTLEVRDRNLKRVGQITPSFLNMKATTRWCGVGEWSITLPGDHAMVEHLLAEGSGVLLVGPDGVVQHPTEYSAWAENRRNMVAYSKATSSSTPSGWSVSGPSTSGDWVICTSNGASTPYIFAGRAQEAIVTGDPIAGRITVQSDSADIAYVRVNVHQRTGNVYFTGSTTQIVVATPLGVPVEVDLSWIATKDIPADDLDISIVPSSSGGGFSVPPNGASFRASYEIISRGTTTGAYFSGASTSPSLLTQYRWLGAANASMSVEETRTVTRPAWQETVYATIMSGPTTTPARKRDAQNPDGTFTFVGVTDEVHLLDALAYPQPSNADVSTQAVANDVRSGKAETLLRQYVDANIGASAPAGRRRGVRSKIAVAGADMTRGIDVVKSPRFQNLLELLREIVTLEPSIGFRMVQNDAVIEFQIVESRDRSAFVRFDIENGTLTSEEVQTTGPSVTYPIVAGQGEGTERQIIARTDAEATAAEATWGRVIETFIDQRDTDDTTELEQSGDEALAEGRGGTSVKVIPADDTTMQLGNDWRAGDVVTVVVAGAETKTGVTETAILLNPDGVRVGAAVGDVSSFTKTDSLGAQVEAIDVRVAQLERAGGLAERLSGKQIDDWNDAVDPGFYYGNNAANAAYSGMVMGSVIIDGGARVVQEAYDPTNLLDGRSRRVLSGGVWGAWKRVGGGLPDPMYAQFTTVPALITATTWALMPGMPDIDVTLPSAAWCQITLSSWLNSGSDLRVGIRLQGATSQSDASWGGRWGRVLRKTAGYEQMSVTFVEKLNAGMTEVQVMAYRAGSGSDSHNYTTLEVAPLRWA